MPRTRWFAAGAPMAAIIAAVTLLLAPRPADAEPARVDDFAERPHTAVLGSLVEPVGAVAGDGVDVLVAATASMIAVATPPPPPPFVCPAPDGEFVDSWGFARSGGRRHKGVDMMAPHGAPVYAPVAGAVRASNSALGGLGFWLEGDDGNTYFGSHLSALHVREGRVEMGEHIGAVGATGNAGGSPHLHFEVILGGVESVNPYPVVAEWCAEGAR